VTETFLKHRIKKLWTHCEDLIRLKHICFNAPTLKPVFDMQLLFTLCYTQLIVRPEDPKSVKMARLKELHLIASWIAAARAENDYQSGFGKKAGWARVLMFSFPGPFLFCHTFCYFWKVLTPELGGCAGFLLTLTYILADSSPFLIIRCTSPFFHPAGGQGLGREGGVLRGGRVPTKGKMTGGLPRKIIKPEI